MLHKKHLPKIFNVDFKLLTLLFLSFTNFQRQKDETYFDLVLYFFLWDQSKFK